MATSQGSSVDVAEQRILALQFVDVIGKKPRHQMTAEDMDNDPNPYRSGSPSKFAISTPRT